MKCGQTVQNNRRNVSSQRKPQPCADVKPFLSSASVSSQNELSCPGKGLLPCPGAQALNSKSYSFKAFSQYVVINMQVQSKANFPNSLQPGNLPWQGFGLGPLWWPLLQEFCLGKCCIRKTQKSLFSLFFFTFFLLPLLLAQDFPRMDVQMNPWVLGSRSISLELCQNSGWD